jgi:hypothetical protein
MGVTGWGIVFNLGIIILYYYYDTTRWGWILQVEAQHCQFNDTVLVRIDRLLLCFPTLVSLSAYLNYLLWLMKKYIYWLFQLLLTFENLDTNLVAQVMQHLSFRLVDWGQLFDSKLGRGGSSRLHSVQTVFGSIRVYILWIYQDFPPFKVTGGGEGAESWPVTST